MSTKEYSPSLSFSSISSIDLDPEVDPNLVDQSDGSDVSEDYEDIEGGGRFVRPKNTIDKTLPIIAFWGHFPDTADKNTGDPGLYIMSNWAPSPFYMIVNNEQVTYISSEQALMDSKALLFGDLDISKKIQDFSDENNLALAYTDLSEWTPQQKKQWDNLMKKIKALGRKVSNFDDNIWSKARENIMFDILMNKFSQNEQFRDYLLNTDNQWIAEASPYDKIWGTGHNVKVTRTIPYTTTRSGEQKTWKGKNILGQALMKTRHYLRYPAVSYYDPPVDDTTIDELDIVPLKEKSFMDPNVLNQAASPDIDINLVGRLNKKEDETIESVDDDQVVTETRSLESIAYEAYNSGSDPLMATFNEHIKNIYNDSEQDIDDDTVMNLSKLLYHKIRYGVTYNEETEQLLAYILPET